jgi:hypothetical protein
MAIWCLGRGDGYLVSPSPIQSSPLKPQHNTCPSETSTQLSSCTCHMPNDY